MSNWNANIMLQQKQVMDQCIERMIKWNDQLLGEVAVYSSVMNDSVQEESKIMLTRIQVLLEEIQNEIKKQYEKLGKAAQIEIKIQSSAKNDISNF